MGDGYTCSAFMEGLRGPGPGEQGRTEQSQPRPFQPPTCRVTVAVGSVALLELASLWMGELSQDEAWASKCHCCDCVAMHRTLCTRLGRGTLMSKFLGSISIITKKNLKKK